MKQRTLMKIGGVFGLLVAATQIGGNALHPPISPDAVEALETIAGESLWDPAHLVITVSYFLFIPFAIGLAAAYEDRGWELWIGIPLVIVGAALGGAQIQTHLTIFQHLAVEYVSAGGGAAGEPFLILYETFWPYSVALEITHLLLIYAAAVILGLAMLRERAFTEWAGWLGVAGGGIAAAGIVIGKLVMDSQGGDLVFGFSLLPLLAWIIVISVQTLKAAKRSRPGSSEAPADGRP